MNILPINLIGDDILRRKTTRVEKVDYKTISLIKDMIDTMHNAKVGVGLAANQVGSNKSIFVIDLSLIKGFENTSPYIFINPKISSFSEVQILMEEGCLSIPNLAADVRRPESIEVSYQDINLKEQILKADGFLARVIQHEYDHLKGILFTDKISGEDKQVLKKEIQRIRNRKVKFNYPTT